VGDDSSAQKCQPRLRKARPARSFRAPRSTKSQTWWPILKNEGRGRGERQASCGSPRDAAPLAASFLQGHWRSRLVSWGLRGLGRFQKDRGTRQELRKWAAIAFGDVPGQGREAVGPYWRLGGGAFLNAEGRCRARAGLCGCSAGPRVLRLSRRPLAPRVTCIISIHPPTCQIPMRKEALNCAVLAFRPRGRGRSNPISKLSLNNLGSWPGPDEGGRGQREKAFEKGAAVDILARDIDGNHVLYESGFDIVVG
jgi:hypothetical protein